MKNKDDRILFELLVYTEWKKEPELVKIDNSSTQRFQLSPSKLFNYFKRNEEWPSQSFFRYINEQLPWLISLSPDGGLVAILQDNSIEIRSAKDDFTIPFGKAGARKDNFPQLRKICWSPDNILIAISSSCGVIDVYDVYCNHIWTLPLPSESPSRKNDSFNVFISGLEFISKSLSKEQWELELLAIYSDGTINEYKMISLDQFPIHEKKHINKTGISCAAYCHQFNLIFIATEPELINKSFQNTNFAAGLSAWSKNKNSSYQMVFPSEDELKIIKSSNGSLWSYFQMSNTTQKAVKLVISQNNQYLASLHCCGTIFIWSIPGLRLYRKWTPLDAVYQPVTWDDDVCIPLDIEWRNEEEIIVSRKDGTILIHKINDFEVTFGSFQEPSNGHPKLASISTFPGFLAIECESLSVSTTPLEALSEDETIVNTSSDLLQSTMYMLTDLEKYQPKKKSIKIIQKIYRLLAIKNTSPEELFYRKLYNNEFEQALQLALEYGINRDIVYQEQWKTSVVSSNSIELYLDKILDKHWIMNECINRVPETLEGASSLIEYGFKLTSFENVFKAQSDKIGVSLEAFNSVKKLSDVEKLAVITRISMITYEEKLSTYKKVLGDSNADDLYNCNEFGKFRTHTYIESAINYARIGNGLAVETLMNYHYDELRPFWLVILNNIPETINPSIYKNILPECDGEYNPLRRGNSTSQKSDWTDHEFFSCFHKPTEISTLTELYGSPCFDYSSKIFTEWYLARALHIEEMCQIVDNSIQLLLLGLERNIQNLKPLYNDFVILEVLVYDLGVDISYKEFSELPPLEKSLLFIQKVNDDNFITVMINYVCPYFDKLKRKKVENSENLISDFMVYISKNYFHLAINFFSYLFNGNVNLIGEPEALISIFIKCVYTYDGTEKFPQILDLIEEIIEWAKHLSLNSGKESILASLDELHNEVFTVEKLKHYHILIPLEEIHVIKHDEDSIKNIIEQMAETTREARMEVMHEELQNYFHDALMLQSVVFSALSVEIIYEVYIRFLLNSGMIICIEIASSVICCRKADEFKKCISYQRSVDLVLESSRKYFNSALQHNDENMVLARLCLYIIKDENEFIKEELDLMRAVRYLYDLNIDIIPLQVRESEDKVKWIDRAISKGDRVYRDSQIIYQLAEVLKLYDDDTHKRQSVISKRLAEAAFDNDDYGFCTDFCLNLMELNCSDGWEICLKLGLYEENPSLTERLDLLLFSAIHCPSNYLQEILNARQLLLIESVSTSEYSSKTTHTEEKVGFHIIDSVEMFYPFFVNHVDECQISRPIHLKFKRSKLNKSLTQMHYLFYDSLHKDCESKCAASQELFLPKNLPVISDRVSIFLLMQINGYLEEEDLLKTVTIGHVQKFIFESTFLALGYLLSLSDPQDSEEFFMVVPESPFTFQLAIYYYSLCSLSYMDDHPILKTPQEIVSWVNSISKCDLKYGNLIAKHRSRYLNYLQAQQVFSLEVGVNSERFMIDENYRKDTIFGLAMSCDKLNLAIDLAIENNLPVTKIVETHLLYLIFESDLSSLHSSLNCTKFSDALKMDSDTVLQKMIRVLPSIDGSNYQKLIMFFTILKELDDQYILHSLTPTEHLQLINKLADLLPDVDYKDLVENHTLVMELFKNSLNYNEDNLIKLSKAIKKQMSAQNHNFKDKEVFLDLAIQGFMEKCLGKKSKSSWISEFKEIFNHLSKVESRSIKCFVNQTVCSRDGALILDYKNRIDALNLLLEWCMEENMIRENMDDLLEFIYDRIDKLKKIWNSFEGIATNNTAVKNYLVSLEHNSGKESIEDILVNCIIDPLVTIDDIKKFHKSTGITHSLEDIVCSLTKKHPTKFDIIMQRILEIGAEFHDDDSLGHNDWGEDVDFSDKDFLPSDSPSENSLNLKPTDGTIPSDSEKNEDFETPITEDLQDFTLLLNTTDFPSEMYSVLRSFLASDITDELRKESIFMSLRFLIQSLDFSRFEYCQKVLQEPMLPQEINNFVKDNCDDDIIFVIWICLCSKIPLLLSFANELLINIKVEELKTYFLSITDSSTDLLTSFLVDSPTFLEIIETNDDEDFNYILIDILTKCGFDSEAIFLRMKVDNVPISLCNFKVTNSHEFFH